MTYNSWSLSDKIAIIASLAAFLQFVALVATFMIMRATARRQLRAYIMIQGGLIMLFDNDSKMIAKVALKNFGQTPGYDFRTWTNMRIGTPGEVAFGAMKDFAQSSIIAPSADLSAPSDILPITPVQISEVKQGKSRIYVWGEVSFVDAFGQRWVFKFEDIDGGFDPAFRLADGQTRAGWGLNPVKYTERRAPG
jgi:hypothetical protein